VSSEISGGKFPKICSNLSENFRKFFEEFFTYAIQLFPSPALQSDAVK